MTLRKYLGQFAWNFLFGGIEELFHPSRTVMIIPSESIGMWQLLGRPNLCPEAKETEYNAFLLNKQCCQPVLYTEHCSLYRVFWKWFCNGSVFAQNVVIGSVYARNNFLNTNMLFFLCFFNKRIPIVWVWGSALNKFN